MSREGGHLCYPSTRLLTLATPRSGGLRHLVDLAAHSGIAAGLILGACRAEIRDHIAIQANGDGFPTGRRASDRELRSCERETRAVGARFRIGQVDMAGGRVVRRNLDAQYPTLSAVRDGRHAGDGCLRPLLRDQPERTDLLGDEHAPVGTKAMRHGRLNVATGVMANGRLGSGAWVPALPRACRAVEAMVSRRAARTTIVMGYSSERFSDGRKTSREGRARAGGWIAHAWHSLPFDSLIGGPWRWMERIGRHTSQKT